MKALSKRTFRLFARLRLPSLTARLLLLVTRPLGEKTGARRYRVLVLNAGKGDFSENIQEIFAKAHDFALLSWPSYALRAMAEPILSPGLHHDHYITDDPAAEASKIAYRRFLKAVWRRYCATARIDAVMSANFAYCVQRELAAALEELGTPFIVLQKENLNGANPVRRALWLAVYRDKRGPFAGRKLLVYNTMERDLQIESGVATANKIAVVGMPGVDRLHRWRNEPCALPHPPQVLFFAFSRDDKLPAELGTSCGWGAFWEDTHRAMIRLARQHPNLRVVAKTKAGRQDDDLARILEAEAQPPNFTVVSGGSSFAVLRASSVVVGFNTTGILEALALGRPVVVPAFGEATHPELRDFVLDLGDAVQHATSPEHLVEQVLHLTHQAAPAAPRLPAHVAQALRHYVGNDDGAAAVRALQVIRDTLAGTEARVEQFASLRHADKSAMEALQKLAVGRT